VRPATAEFVLTVVARCDSTTNRSRPTMLRPGLIGRRTAGPGALSRGECGNRETLALDSPGSEVGPVTGRPRSWVAAMEITIDKARDPDVACARALSPP
jgi:hypothetical protein